MGLLKMQAFQVNFISTKPFYIYILLSCYIGFQKIYIFYKHLVNNSILQLQFTQVYHHLCHIIWKIYMLQQLPILLWKTSLDHQIKYFEQLKDTPIHPCVCFHWLCFRKQVIKIHKKMIEKYCVKPLLCKSCSSFSKNIKLQSFLSQQTSNWTTP